MSSGSWQQITVRELVEKGQAEIKTGPFGTQLHASDYVHTGTPVINARNIGFGNIRVDKLEYISDETVKRLSSHLLRPADIVFGRKGTVERHVFIQQAQNNWFQGTDCLRLRLKSPDVEPRYVSYYLTTEYHKQWIINQSSHGATMTSLNQDIISRISFPLPPLPVQRKIAEMLSTYDDLIEVNTRRIRILEQMAQSVYREWFGKVEVKSLPEEWEETTLFEVCDQLTSGGTPSRKSSEYWDDGEIDWFKTKELNDSFLFSSEEKISQLGFQNSSAKLFPAGTVVMAIYAAPTVGRLGILTQPSTFNQAACGLTPKSDKITTSFLFYKLLEMRVYFNSLAQGAAQQNISVQKVRSAKIYLPPFEDIQQFDSIVSPIFELMKVLQSKNANLRRTRDLLLPRLVSGEVGVNLLESLR